METRKRPCLTCTTDTQVQKTSGILDMRREAPVLGSPEVDEVEEHQTVVTALPTEVQSLGSTNHIHVQLFDGQVIQITSTPLEETEVERKRCEGDVKQNGSSIIGEESGENTVTLLTSNGKTYILPQPLSSAEDGSYLISEDVLQSGSVLHEEQILTISPPPPPPPPPPQLNFASSVASHPDALAIATNEVFSEGCVSVPVQTEGPLAEPSNTFRVKTVDGDNTQKINKIYTYSTSDTQSRNLLIPDASIITINASDNGGSDEWVENNSHFIAKKLVKKCSNDEILSSQETVDLSAPRCRVREAKDYSDAKQVQLDSTTYSAYSKWIDVQDNISSKMYTITATPKVSAKKDKQGEIRIVDVVSAKLMSEKEENDKKGVQITNSKNAQSGTFLIAMQDKTMLRRSSRIKKVKKIPNEEESELAEEAGTWKGIKGEAASSLWECGSCDAMFRTRVGRDRHMKEGHAFTCYVCGWEGHSKTKYEVHISTVHCNQQARCLSCRKDFPSYEAYKQHMKETHSTTTAMSTSASNVTSVASTTTTTTTTTAPLDAFVNVKMEVESDTRLEEQVEQEEEQCSINTEEKHIPNSADFKSFHSYGERGCPYCSKTFTRRSRFLRHLNYHLGKRTFMCKICTKCFVEKSGLDAHLLTHCPINKVCPQCDKVFKTERTMNRHLRTHLNLTYTCDFCNKQFRHEESLRVHKTVHKEGGSGNVCTVCEKDCKTPHYLQLHMSTKHEAAKFTCHQCKRSFKWKQSFRKHMAIHHGDAYKDSSPCPAFHEARVQSSTPGP